MLDFPDVNIEKTFLQRSTDLSRTAFIIKANAAPTDLTEEVYLLSNSFWLDSLVEHGDSLAIFHPSLEHVRERIERAQDPAYLPYEQQAVQNAIMENGRRGMQRLEEERERIFQRVLPILRP